MSKLLVCNIGWMLGYQGVTENDAKPQGGGKYNEDNVGHEACNFLSCEDGFCYGYVQPSSKYGTIDIGKISKGFKERIDGVTVVWVSRNPDPNFDETVIVGWYSDATVYMRPVEYKKYPSKQHKKYKIKCFSIKAKSENTVVLPKELRYTIIPRTRSKKQSGLGRSNIWFLSQEKDKKIRKNIFKVIDAHELGYLGYNDIDFSAIEGQSRLQVHITKERNPKLVQEKKKDIIKKTKKLTCEACGFNFKEFYGELLQNEFCEVHHRVPLAELAESRTVCLDDLAILCSNCHRIIHKTIPIMSVENFAKKLVKRK